VNDVAAVLTATVTRPTLTGPQIHRALGWSDTTLRKKWQRGEFPPPAFGEGKARRWYVSAVLVWLDEQKRKNGGGGGDD
jgi:predicted DNA-binding transcriptional regulator AlpA